MFYTLKFFVYFLINAEIDCKITYCFHTYFNFKIISIKKSILASLLMDGFLFSANILLHLA